MSEGAEGEDAVKKAPPPKPSKSRRRSPGATKPKSRAKPKSAKAHAPAHAEEPTGVEAVVEDLFHVDFKVPRTLRDLVISPSKVADAALAGDHSQYTRPLRAFLVVIALQAVVTGWLAFNDTGTFAVLFVKNPAALAHVSTRLAQAGTSLTQADEVIRHWTDWAGWPLMMVSSLLYALVIWATRPSLGLVKSTLLYLVAATASYLATLPITVITGLAGPETKVWGAVIGFVALFVYAGLVLHRRVAKTAAGLLGRLAVLALATIPVVVVALALVFVIVEIAFRADTGLSRLQLLREAYGIHAG